jgi:HK97 family phage major capsid protein
MEPEGSKTDAMINRLEREIAERDSFIQGTVANAQDTERDLTSSEQELITEARKRIEVAEEQADTLRAASVRAQQARQKTADVQNQLASMRRHVDQGEIEYRSAGHYALDSYKSAMGDRQATERLEFFHRAAAHQKTTDNLGVVPDPIVGDVLNFVDAGRPLASAIGIQNLPAATFYRPRVTQGTTVGLQGSAGAAADEKSELVSQKMTISRTTATAITYGGYVNVSRQDIDFSSPQIMDIIIRDLAARYAIQTELATGAALMASGTTAVGYGASPTAATLRAALWTAASGIYTAVQGQGRVILAFSPGRLAVFGPLFAPITGVVANGEGLSAGNFGSGTVGSIGGIEAIMSPGLTGTQAVLFSTAAIECFEQRVGTLQVTEPSVLGVQVAYAGYFTPLRLVNAAIVPLTAT